MPNLYPSESKTLLDRMLPWMTGITMPLLIIVLTALWGVSAQMSAYAAENEILKVRVTQNERAMLDIKTSTNEITESVQKMEVIQSTHNALMQSEVAHIKKDLAEFVRDFEASEKNK